MTLLAGKRALITGIASQRSIAYGIAEAMQREGAELVLTYQNDKLKPRVEKMAEAWQALPLPCDVASDASIDQMYAQLAEHWDGFDILVHAIGYAPADQLEGDYVEAVHREGFATALDISAYSFSALAKGARPLMQERQGSLLTLSYLGAERVLPNYNVMGVAKAALEANVRYMAASLGGEGIRVNAISAGPIRTLAASGIKSFRKMMANNAAIAPLKSNVSLEQVGNSAVFLCSDWASGITGEVLHVDAGYHCVGYAELEEKD